jgi:hypothetical protein
MKAVNDAVTSGNVAESALRFVTRWNPWTRAIVNRTPQRTGLNEYYNSVNAIRAAAPAEMESKARQGGASYQPSATTPLIREMVNAAFNGDDAGFQKAYDAAVAQKEKAGVANADLAVREAFMARNPYLQPFRTLPTDSERATILSRLTPDQQAELLKGEQVFQKYGEQLGSNVAFTLEQREGNKPVAQERTARPTGDQNISLGALGSHGGSRGGIRLPRSSGVNRLHRGRSYATGTRLRGMKAPRLHRPSRGTVKSVVNRIRRKRKVLV